MHTQDIYLSNAISVYDTRIDRYTYISTQFDVCQQQYLQFEDVNLPIFGTLCPKEEAEWALHIAEVPRSIEHIIKVQVHDAEGKKYLYQETRRVLCLVGYSIIEKIISVFASSSEKEEDTPSEEPPLEEVLSTFIDFVPLVQSLLGRSEQGVIVTDIAGNIRVANETVFAFFGLGYRSFFGEKIWKIFPLFSNLKDSFLSRPSDTTHPLATRKRWVEFYEPATRWLQIECFPTTFGFTFNLVDVSKEFQQNEKIGILSSVAMNSLSSIIITNKEGYIEWVNKAFETITGYTIIEAIGKKPGDLLQGKNTDPETVNAIRLALKERKPFVGEILNYHKTHYEYWVRLEIDPVFDDEGKLLRFISVQVDTTEYHRNAELLASYNERLEEKITDRTIEILRKNHELEAALERMAELSQEQDDILALVAHDLKNPLTSIMLNCSLLRRQPSATSDSKVTKYLDSIERTSERIDHIIKYILSSYQRSNGTNLARMQSTICNLSETVTSVAKEFELLAIAKEIRCEVNIQNSATYTITDQNAVLHILENLLSNAIKYAPNNSMVTVGIYPADTYEGYIAIFVRDQGPGFTADDKTKLFKKFQRLSAKPTGGEHSTGLGLSLVKKLVRAIHGEIFLNDTYTQGAEFVLCVPCNILREEVAELDHIAP